MNKKYNFIKSNTLLLDIGCSPGGWSQVAKQVIKKGKIVSIDLKHMENLEGVKFIKCNFMDPDSQSKILSIFNGKIDVILSDMAANTTGNRTLDCIRTNLLGAEVINNGSKMLKSNGTLIVKLFMGEDFLEVKNIAKKKFKKVDFFKPESSRGESKETYIHCNSLKAL